MDRQASRLIEQLSLTAHPKGGYYREFFRSTITLSTPRGTRSASTAIWFLLAAGEFSAFHQVLGADEVWHHCGGDPLLLHLLDERGARTVVLGPDLAAREQPLSVVPAGVLQAAEQAGRRFSLCACIVAPGFDFADFVLPSRADLCASRIPAPMKLAPPSATRSAMPPQHSISTPAIHVSGRPLRAGPSRRSTSIDANLVPNYRL